MNKIICLLFCTVLGINVAFPQSEHLKELVEKTKQSDLDMWELVDFAKEHLQEREDLAKFFYYWVSTNITYDNEFLERMGSGDFTYDEFDAKQTDYAVYTNRKAVCAGFANLYKWFMDQLDIEAVVVLGHIRDERNHYLELDSDDDFGHAWNAVKLNDTWILVDTTWGTSSNKGAAEFYYNIKPEYAILTHFPEDSKWQLLEQPLSLEAFNKSQYVKAIWFMNGFTEIPKLMADQDYYYRFQDLSAKSISADLMISTDNVAFTNIEGLDKINQDGYTYLRFKKEHIPDVAYFKVNMMITSESGSYIYQDVINFKL